MKCPKCKKKMELVNEDYSFNLDVKPKKKYTRALYWCKQDDVWLKTEIPVFSKK